MASNYKRNPVEIDKGIHVVYFVPGLLLSQELTVFDGVLDEASSVMLVIRVIAVRVYLVHLEGSKDKGRMTFYLTRQVS